MPLVTTVTRFKAKPGAEDELVESLKAFDNSNSLSWQIIALSANEFAAINTYDSIEERSDDVVTGLTWLDSISHLLELYDDSRTKAFSGIIIAANEVWFSRSASFSSAYSLADIHTASALYFYIQSATETLGF